MKKFILASLAALLLAGPGTMAWAAPSSPDPSAPGDVEWDGSFAFASGPGSFDDAGGINFGAGHTLVAVNRNFQARFDLSFFRFNRDFPWGRGQYTRSPLTISGRYFLPIKDRLRGFFQAGLETSFDNLDFLANGVKETRNEVNFGISPAAGIEMFVKRNISVFALGRSHLISDGYFSMHFGMASHY